MSTTRNENFIGYLHSFRGFAILCILAIHALIPPLIVSNNMQGLDMTNPVAIGNEVLFHDSTIYFAIISGILFTAVLKAKGWRRFYTSKLKYVVLPYIFFSALFTLVNFLTGQMGEIELNAVNYFRELGLDLIFGTSQFQFWYIPVLFFLYAVTPLLDWLGSNKNLGLIPLILIILTPLVVSRIPFDGSRGLHIETMIYFTGSYALGMLIGTDLEKSMDWFNRNIMILIGVSVISTAMLIYGYMNDINLVGPDSFKVSLLESLFYIQKIALSGLVLVGFKNMEARQPTWLDGFATDAFGLYFLHGFFAFMTFIFMMPLFQTQNSFMIILNGLLVFAFSLIMSTLVIRGMRLLLGKRSRMIVGS
ncbi:MAG: acyltransferase [Bacteroidota bacterium]